MPPTASDSPAAATDTAGDAAALYLVWHDPEAAPAGPLDLHGDGHPLADGLWLVRSPLSRSKLYHRIKWQLPGDAALACAPLGRPTTPARASSTPMRRRPRKIRGIPHPSPIPTAESGGAGAQSAS